MDVELLTRMLGDLILDNDTVGLPGLGSFVAEQMPSTFSDKGYTINPPYRRLTFLNTESKDGLLSSLYARDNSITVQEADTILASFLGSLAVRLREEKLVELPGLGRLRATRENHFFFVADEDLDISPDYCGLDPVSLKTHRAVALPEVPVAPVPNPVSDGKTPEIRQPEPETALSDGNSPEIRQPGVLEPAPAVADAEEPETEAAPPARRPRRRLPAVARWAIGAACCAVLLLGALAALGRLAPDVADRLLYSKEELEILNYPEDGLGLSR